MKYRPEIDGLRALAVVPVILFHADVAGFSGGYIGVDIFFVISGFLITKIIRDDLAAGRFSIMEFYERRARRILPALTVVLLACVPFAWAWMLPQELEAFGRSLITTVFFVSNILFWREDGYFGAAVELKPLLHTWSLAVEEQYYLFFPVFLALLWRWRKAWILPVCILLIVCSLLLAEWGTRFYPVAAFYLLPTRIWELLIGAVVALRFSGNGARSNVLGCLGLIMIILPVYWFDSTTRVPSVWTLIPVTGAALVLACAREGSFAARILNIRPLVAIGLVSYSAYLWHQPLLVFARMRNMQDPHGMVLLLLVAGTFVLAWLSWRFVEQPFRGAAALLTSRTQVWGAIVSSIFLVTTVGTALALGGGFGNRLIHSGGAVADLEHHLAPNYGLHQNCDAGKFTLSPQCRTADIPEMVLWGDSYAMHLAPALRASPTQLGLVQLTLSQCGPFPGLAVNGRHTSWRSCLAFNDAALEWILRQESVHTVVISSIFGQEMRQLRDRSGAVMTPEQARAAMFKSIGELADQLAARGKNLVIVSPPPRTGQDLGMCFARNQLTGQPENMCDFPILQDLNFSNAARDFLTMAQGNIDIVWLHDVICTDSLCRTALDGVPLYRDAGHLSSAGSEKLGASSDLVGLILSTVSQ